MIDILGVRVNVWIVPKKQVSILNRFQMIDVRRILIEHLFRSEKKRTKHHLWSVLSTHRFALSTIKFYVVIRVFVCVFHYSRVVVSKCFSLLYIFIGSCFVFHFVCVCVCCFFWFEIQFHYSHVNVFVDFVIKPFNT